MKRPQMAVTVLAIDIFRCIQSGVIRKNMSVPQNTEFPVSKGPLFYPWKCNPPPFSSHQIDREQLNSLVNKHVNTLHFCRWFFVSFSCHGLCLVLTCKGVVKYLHWVTLFHKQVHPDLIKPIPVVWALKTN